MRNISLPWPVGFWSPDVFPHIAPPVNWPTSVDNAQELTGFPAIATPVTLTQASEFFARLRQATIVLDLDFGGGDTYHGTLLLKRFSQNNGVGEILAGDERSALTGPFIFPGINSPYYYASKSDTVGAAHVESVLEMFTEYIWFDKAADIAFFNLSVLLGVTASINGNEYSFGASSILPALPGYQLGFLDLYTSSLPLYGQEIDNPYTFSLSSFAGSKWFPYALEDGTQPIWDADLGIKLRDHRLGLRAA